MQDLHYFYTGAEGPALGIQGEAFQRYLANKSRGEYGRADHEVVMNSCREQLAVLMGVAAEKVAMVSNASEALHRIIESIDWSAGANVVTCDIEFPSVTLPLVSLKARGVDIRVVKNHDWQVTANDIAESVDDHTQAIVLSHVSYMSGSRFDITELAAIARRVGALLVIDATQSLGVVPVDASQADFVLASTYKWLLGAHGTGVLYVRDPEAATVLPEYVGWRSVQHMFAPDRFERYDLWQDARRWELGYPSFPSIYLLEASLRYLGGFQPAEIEAHVLELGGRILEGTRELGMKSMTPVEPSHRAGNIAIRATEPVRLAESLAARDVIAWGGDGRIRFSVHLFNDAEDVEAALVGLREFRREL